MSDLGAKRWEDAVLAVRLLAVAPAVLGGLVLRSRPDPRRDALLSWFRNLLGDAPLLRVPLHITDDRLLGGLSLAATLARRAVVHEAGVLPRADGGAVVMPMAERLEARVTAALAAALDHGELRLEREGVAATVACQIGVVALDEGIDDERVPPALQDRLAFHVDVDALGRAVPAAPTAEAIASARRRLPNVHLDEAVVDALCRAAWGFGIESLRVPVLAARAARVHAALEGRDRVEAEDATVAARLVLGPRATRRPEAEPEDEDEPAQDDEPEAPPPPPGAPEGGDEGDAPPLDELLLEAVESGIPGGVLDALVVAGRRAPRGTSGGRAGQRRASTRGGRPAGTRVGAPRDGERLALVETLRAAAPWQRLRERAGARVEVRRGDFRVRRYQEKTETTVIFAVDASGSAALRRLAEAKGAVEQVLIDCYARRDQVALIAFRGTEATLVLHPTRSLTRARRRLASMVGGGTTPLAAGIEAATALARDAHQQGRTPIVVFMTDGRGNVARDGAPDPARAQEDAQAAAGALRVEGVATLFLDTAPRPRARARRLADAMGARYMPLPYVDARGISGEVQTLRKAPAA